MKYSEDNPRIEGTYQASASNIKWVGGVDNYLVLNLKPTDKIINFNAERTSANAGGDGIYKINIYIDDVLVETFISDDKTGLVSKSYDLSNNSSFKAQVKSAAGGSLTYVWTYKIW